VAIPKSADVSTRRGGSNASRPGPKTMLMSAAVAALALWAWDCAGREPRAELLRGPDRPLRSNQPRHRTGTRGRPTPHRPVASSAPERVAKSTQRAVFVNSPRPPPPHGHAKGAARRAGHTRAHPSGPHGGRAEPRHVMGAPRSRGQSKPKRSSIAPVSPSLRSPSFAARALRTRRRSPAVGSRAPHCLWWPARSFMRLSRSPREEDRIEASALVLAVELAGRARSRRPAQAAPNHRSATDARRQRSHARQLRRLAHQPELDLDWNALTHKRWEATAVLTYSPERHNVRCPARSRISAEMSTTARGVYPHRPSTPRHVATPNRSPIRAAGGTHPVGTRSPAQTETGSRPALGHVERPGTPAVGTCRGQRRQRGTGASHPLTAHQPVLGRREARPATQRDDQVASLVEHRAHPGGAGTGCRGGHAARSTAGQASAPRRARLRSHLPAIRSAFD